MLVVYVWEFDFILNMVNPSFFVTYSCNTNVRYKYTVQQSHELLSKAGVKD